MFDNLLMSMNSKLKKIMSVLETNEGKIDEISTDVGFVGTSVATVQSTSDEIKALIGTEIATQLSALEANVISAMSGGNSGLTSCIKSIQRGSYTFTSSSNATITIKSVDPNKTVVLLNTDMTCVTGYPGSDYSSSYGYVYTSQLSSISNTSIVLTPARYRYYASSSGATASSESGYCTVYYQVVEFY